MKAEIITIGDEILIGQIVDTNSAWMGQQLNAVGISVHQITSISDKAEHILEAVANAEKAVDLVLITGGLGPTKDDITKTTLSQYFDSELVRSEVVLENIRRLLAKWSRSMQDLNRDQALVPACCTVLNNEVGTAPGMWFEREGTVFVSMPGVPSEMKWLMSKEVLPRITLRFKTPTIVHRTVLTHGVPESVLANILNDWENNLPEDMKLAYLPSIGTIRLRLSVIGDDEQTINKRMDARVADLQMLIPEHIFGYGEQTMEQVVGLLLKKHGATLATAESCTGGNIAELMTSLAGSSDYFKGGVVAYSNAVKMGVLKVQEQTLNEHGAVSQAVVELMAQNTRVLLETDYAISVSGVAGPGGGTPSKPVGTVWICVSGPRRTVAKKFNFTTDRSRNIRYATLAALNMLRLELLK